MLLGRMRLETRLEKKTKSKKWSQKYFAQGW